MLTLIESPLVWALFEVICSKTHCLGANFLNDFPLRILYAYSVPTRLPHMAGDMTAVRFRVNVTGFPA